MKIRARAPAALSLAAWLLSGCSHQYLDNQAVTPTLPSHWQSPSTAIAGDNQWLDSLATSALTELIQRGLANNQQVKQAAYQVAIEEQALTISDAKYWPELALSATAGRTGTDIGVNDGRSVDIDASYEIDIWGKLSDTSKRANLTLLSAQAKLEQQKQSLTASIATRYYQIGAANELVELYKQRVSNAKTNLDIIESGYLQGLNSALDLYLAQNEYYSEQANLTEQQNEQGALTRQLERLLGGYPSGHLLVQAQLPLLPSAALATLPSELVKQKPSLQSAWYQLLAQDALVAFTHKQRFPSLKLSAGFGQSNNEFSGLFSSNATAWSLFAGVTAPLFNAGRLKAQTEQQKLILKQQEQAYLDTLFDTFEEVENRLSSSASLHQQYQATLAAQENATQAQLLAFEQYQSGLVNYTTVLEAQKRAFTAQSSVILLKNQIITNRIALHLAIGGDLSAATVSESQ